MSESGCILIVDDDRATRQMLVEYLRSHGFKTVEADGGVAMREAIERDPPDVVLLDIRLPGEDGLTLARYLRERYDVGIIMVTGAGEVIDRIVGLEVGADDYVAKPFDPRELLARVKSVLRRLQARPAGNAPAPTAAARRVPIGRCELDLDAYRLVDGDGREVPITAMEFELLKVFVDHPGKALSRDMILERVWGTDVVVDPRTVDNFVSNLKRKLGWTQGCGYTIRAVRGVGYRLELDAAEGT